MFPAGAQTEGQALRSRSMREAWWPGRFGVASWFGLNGDTFSGLAVPCVPYSAGLPESHCLSLGLLAWVCLGLCSRTLTPRPPLPWSTKGEGETRSGFNLLSAGLVR
jgi:hypothetical protein